jgi:hypothetical protein
MDHSKRKHDNIRDEVDAGELLHELATDAEHSPVKEFLGAVLEKGLEAAALGG